MKKVWILIILLTGINNLYAQPAGGDSPFRLRGYFRAMPGLQVQEGFSDASFHNLLHNRLNFRWRIFSNMEMMIEGRNRLIYSKAYGELPDIGDFFNQDDYLVDISWLWASGGGWIGHSEIDRFFVSWRTDNWRIRAGRQRVNWGINIVSNPNDLFNTYSFFDFDYAERPGADAIRIQHFFDGMSSVEVAVRPGRSSKEMVAATKLLHNWKAYDLQAIAGVFRNRLALGGGWAGHLGGAGFKGEATWFYDLSDNSGGRRDNIVAAAGLDYMFSTGTFGIVEFLYNGGHGRITEQAVLITEPLRPDNIMFSEYAVTISADHAFSPVFSGGIALMGLPDIDAAFLMPRINYSVHTDIDLELISQVFLGGDGSIFEQAGTTFFGSLKYSF